MDEVIDDFLNRDVLVYNASEDEYELLDNALELYYKYFPSRDWSSYYCPSCGKKMFRKKDSGKQPFIVGGHVKTKRFPDSVYILPICEECNDKKGNLKPFIVKRKDLLKLK